MGHEYVCPECGVYHGTEYSFGCLPMDNLCDICAEKEFEKETYNKALDEVIAKWKWWFDQGFERPIKKDTIVKLIESMRK